jgi:hypothetical protein
MSTSEPLSGAFCRSRSRFGFNGDWCETDNQMTIV